MSIQTGQKASIRDKEILLRPTINGSRQTSCLPLQMEFHIQIKEVLKCLPRDFTDRTLANVGKDGVEKFTREGGSDPCSSI
jgi:hypothetical protein